MIELGENINSQIVTHIQKLTHSLSRDPIHRQMDHSVHEGLGFQLYNIVQVGLADSIERLLDA